MKFGLTAEQYTYIHDLVVKPLEAMNAQVWCYGSRARGDYKPYSDLDIMVESPHDLSGVIEQIKERLTNSNFPYKVDIVEYKHFADAYKASYRTDKVPFRQLACP